MLVSNWAQNYWAVSTVAKKTLYNYKNVYGGVVEPFIGSKDLDEVSLMDIQKLVLATTPYQARLALMIIKTLYREAKLYGMTDIRLGIGSGVLLTQPPFNMKFKSEKTLLSVPQFGGFIVTTLYEIQ